MNIPLAMPFNPTLRSCLFFFALAASIFVADAWIGDASNRMFLCLSGVLATIALLLLMRRYLWPRQLVLDGYRMLVPTGFLRLGTACLSRDAIQRIWITELMGVRLMCIRTAEVQVEMPIVFFPNPAVFTELYEYLIESKAAATQQMVDLEDETMLTKLHAYVHADKAAGDLVPIRIRAFK